MRRSFDAALEDIERQDASDEAPLRPIAIISRAISIPPADIPGVDGGSALWDLAAAWTPEADPALVRPRPPAPEIPRPSAKPEAIAEELGLERLQTASELAQARRRFMWDNHPDRRKDLDRDLANRRVAIANMLLDRARAVMLRRRRGR